MVNFGRQGLNLAATAAVTAAVKVSFCLHKLLLRLDIEQCDSTEDLPLLYKDKFCNCIENLGHN